MRQGKLGRSRTLVLAVMPVVQVVARISNAHDRGVDSPPLEIGAFYAAGQYRQAADALEALAQRNPTDAVIQYWLGGNLFEIRDCGRAISSFERAISLDAGRSEYHDWLGRACGRKADESSQANMALALSMARRTHNEFETAVQLDNTNIDAQRDLIEFMASAPGNLGGGENHALDQIHVL